ncbi:MAG TPA: NUDIX domain-containing protein [Thermoanaerobaculia bacterium]|nr:NUDIX domain-containing protein [Thermoanaerobaculia bacterium]
MLQQTTVATVTPRYAAFLRRFPTLATLARASEEDVLAAWSGLGYYARARHLRLAAREIRRVHGGCLPREPEVLRTLPGFGPYTAAAVASIAYGARVPAADANVTRVLSRIHALGAAAGSTAHARQVRARSAELLARGRPGDVTAALMDLGQLVCTPRRPACEACPLESRCQARRRRAAESFPRKRPRPETSRAHVAAACAVRDGRALLVRGESVLLRGLWQFPAAEGRSPQEAARRLRRALAALGLELERNAEPGLTRHTMVHRRLEIRVYPARPAPRGPKSSRRGPKSVRWFSARRLAVAAIPTLTRRVARAAGFLGEAARP